MHHLPEIFSHATQDTENAKENVSRVLQTFQLSCHTFMNTKSSFQFDYFCQIYFKVRINFLASFAVLQTSE